MTDARLEDDGDPTGDWPSDVPDLTPGEGELFPEGEETTSAGRRFGELPEHESDADVATDSGGHRGSD
jgi:hypothetical protein